LSDGLITKEQLQEAVANQVIFGGRLGTNLLEFGYLDEETLAKYLARQHRVKTVRLVDLAGLNPVVIKIIPKRLAEKYQAVPIRLDQKKLYVVMSDPSAMGAISELSFVTGKIIVPLVLPEVRIFDLLNQYYGLGRELRYINIAMMEAERRKKAKPVAKITPVKKRPGSPEAIKEELKEKIVSKGGGELSTEEDFEKMTAVYQQKEAAVEEELGRQSIKDIAQPEAEAPLKFPPLQPVPSLPIPKAPEPSPPKPGASGSGLRPVPAAGPKPAAAPARAAAEQPYKQVARAIYDELLKVGLGAEIPTQRLKEFLKPYVLSELKDFALPLKKLYGFLVKELGTHAKMVDRIMENIQGLESRLMVRIIMPGTEAALAKPAPAPEAVSSAGPEEEVVELEEEVIELQPLPAEPEVTYLPEPEQIPEEPVAEPEIPQLSFAQATSELMEKTQNRDDLAKAVLGFAKGFFKRAVLFTVRDNILFGWFGTGQGIKNQQVQKLLIEIKEPSVFKTVVECSCHYLGPVLAQPVNQQFLEAMGGAKPNSVFLIPLLWQQKVVYLLYGDNGDGQNVTFDIGELLILAQKLPAGIQRLIEEKKRQYQVIQGGKQ